MIEKVYYIVPVEQCTKTNITTCVQKSTDTIRKNVAGTHGILKHLITKQAPEFLKSVKKYTVEEIHKVIDGNPEWENPIDFEEHVL